MLVRDNNKFIKILYDVSLDLYNSKENRIEQPRFYSGELEEEDEEQEEQEDFDDVWEKQNYKCITISQQFCLAAYKDVKKQKANDIYIFEQNPNPHQILLTHQEKYILYPRKEILKQIIEKTMTYQENSNLVDYHPNSNDLSDDIKQLVMKQIEEQMKKQRRRNRNILQKKLDQKNLNKIVKVRNVIHQSLQPYNKLFTTSNKQEQIDAYFERQESNCGLDQWGKQNKVSNSQFLWLPTEFIYSEQKQMYEIQGKLFNPLENCPQLHELKEELGHLMTYFSDPLIQTHNYFKQLQYRVMKDYTDFDQEKFINDVKQQVDFSKRIHAIVKITEMEIQPGCTYSGQWHVEGFSSDNILYTCLYVIEHDKNLVDGRLIFKRTPRADDVPADPYRQRQCAHQYCPDYENLCDPYQLIPLGKLDMKEDLMIIFPNQNIHKVKGIRNTTNQPLKRKIIAFFIVNHIDQPFTINDVEFTQPIEVIKQNRLRDIFERSKNKQTESQSFNYCEH